MTHARNLVPLVVPAFMGLTSAGHSQSSIEIYEQRVNHCMDSPSSEEYASDICVAFRDGVIYARDALKGAPSGGMTQYTSYSTQVLKPSEQDALIEDLLKLDVPSSMILSVDPSKGTVSAAPVAPMPRAIAPELEAPTLQHVR